MEALRQVHHPQYTAIVLRRTFGRLGAANGLIARSLRWFPIYGGTYNKSDHVWTFPSGAQIFFGHIEHDGDEQQYQGAEFCYVFFDELTEFTEQMYLYLFTRCRAPAPGLRAYVRGATNPGGIGHAFVKRRFISRDIVNAHRWYAPIKNDKGVLVDTEVDRTHVDEFGTPDSLSRAFFPGKLADNPSADPGYRARIRATGDPVRIAQLELGDWDAEYKEGLIYDTWSSTENVTSEAVYRPDQPIYWAVDDGYVFGDGPGSVNYHPRVILWVQDNALGGLDVIDEYSATGENHEETLRKVLRDNGANEYRWQQYHRPEAVYMPSEAALFRGEIHKHGLTTINATHRVSEGIKAKRQLIVTSDGSRLLRVNPLCQGLIYEFGVYRSNEKGKADTGEVIPEKVDDHYVDALRYLAFKRRYFMVAQG